MSLARELVRQDGSQAEVLMRESGGTDAIIVVADQQRHDELILPLGKLARPFDETFALVCRRTEEGKQLKADDLIRH